MPLCGNGSEASAVVPVPVPVSVPEHQRTRCADQKDRARDDHESARDFACARPGPHQSSGHRLDARYPAGATPRARNQPRELFRLAGPLAVRTGKDHAVKGGCQHREHAGGVLVAYDGGHEYAPRCFGQRGRQRRGTFDVVGMHAFS